MANNEGGIDPGLLVVKRVGDLPVNENPKELLTTNSDGDLTRSDYSTLKGQVSSGIRGEAKPDTVPTPWNPGDPNLYEKYDVKTEGIFSNFKDSTGSAIVVSAGDLRENLVQIWVYNGVSEKVLSGKPIVTAEQVYDPLNDTNPATMKAASGWTMEILPVKISEEKISVLQTKVDFKEGELGVVVGEVNPANNGIYRKIGGVGSGGWEKTNFNNPLFIKDLSFGSMAIGGGHTSLFADEEGQGVGHTAFGEKAGLGLGNCWATTLIGWHTGMSLSNASVVNTYSPDSIGNTGNTWVGYNVGSIANGTLDCTIVGTSAGENITTAMDTCLFGIWSGRNIAAGSENAFFGHATGMYIIGKGSRLNIDSTVTDINSPDYSWGHKLTMVGDQAGRFESSANEFRYGKKSVYVGANTRPKEQYTYNENVFGYFALGRGTDTLVLGNIDVKETSFHGILRNWTDRRFVDLPMPNRDLLGSRSFILDADTRVFDAIVSGGGSNHMPVWCDGSSWRIG